jgi:plastocyanin
MIVLLLAGIAAFFLFRRIGSPSVVGDGGGEEKFDVAIENSSFSPQRFLVKKGGRVTWKNLDNVAHTVTASVFRGQRVLRPGETFTLLTDSLPFPGEISYQCDFHRGMTGVLAVQPENLSGAFSRLYLGLSEAKQDCLRQALGNRFEGFLSETITIPTKTEQAAIERCTR